MNRLSKAWSRYENLWLGKADARVYALLRIAFAIVALLNLISLWPDRHAFLADTGLIDLQIIRLNTSGEPRFSLFYFFPSEQAVDVIMLISAAALVLLALGILPRLMSVIAFLWHLSYSYRAFPVIHSWDMVLRILAFVIMISPIGRVWRLPNLWRPGQTDDQGSPGLARYGLLLTQLQLTVIYWQTFWLKVADGNWRSGDFISYFMLSMYSRYPDEAWAEWQLLSCLLTYGTLVLELTIPILLFFPRTRWIGFLGGIGLHLGIMFLSTIWLFQLVILVPYIAFLDRRDMDWIVSWFGGKPSQSTAS